MVEIGVIIAANNKPNTANEDSIYSPPSSSNLSLQVCNSTKLCWSISFLQYSHFIYAVSNNPAAEPYIP